ncbi:protein kinase [Bifidobacterium sp. SO4]|uniref:serine/threonine protein kinase n=1 Tax=Bifidobacterium sp. SO4 TaxID=2809030 RepID=UPI0032049130
MEGMSDLNALNLEPGEVVGGYTLISRLGSGAMGSVWRVRDDGGQTYAMKILRDSLAEESDDAMAAGAGPAAEQDPNLKPDVTPRERLRREAMALKKVNHPGVCGIVDMELDDSLAFIVTELIEGRNLKDDVAVNGRYIGDDLERLARKLIEAVKAVHAAGIVHRDIKPTNVMVSASGPVLVDFGIAMGEGESHVTRTGLVMGTPGFIAPEIIEGAESDEMTDWWSVASVLAFAATGAPVFGVKPMMAVLERAASGNANLTGLPAGTLAAFRSALSPDRSKRCTPDQLLHAIALDALNPAAWQGTQAGPFGAGAIAGGVAALAGVGAGTSDGTEAMPPFGSASGATAGADPDNPRTVWRTADDADIIRAEAVAGGPPAPPAPPTPHPATTVLSAGAPATTVFPASPAGTTIANATVPLADASGTRRADAPTRTLVGRATDADHGTRVLTETDAQTAAAAPESVRGARGNAPRTAGMTALSREPARTTGNVPAFLQSQETVATTSLAGATVPLAERTAVMPSGATAATTPAPLQPMPSVFPPVQAGGILAGQNGQTGQGAQSGQAYAPNGSPYGTYGQPQPVYGSPTYGAVGDTQPTIADPTIRPALQRIIDQTAQASPTEAIAQTSAQTLAQSQPGPNPADVRRGEYLSRGTLPLWLIAVPLALLASVLPVIALFTAAAVLWLLLTLAYNAESQLEREGRRGGERKGSDSLIRAATLPWHLLKGLLLMLPRLALMTTIAAVGTALAAALLNLPVETVDWVAGPWTLPIPVLTDMSTSPTGLVLGGFTAAGWLVTAFGPRAVMVRLGAGVLRGIRRPSSAAAAGITPAGEALLASASPALGPNGSPNTAAAPKGGRRDAVLIVVWLIAFVALGALSLSSQPIDWTPLL